MRIGGAGIRAIFGGHHAVIRIAIMHQSARNLLEDPHRDHHIQGHLDHRYIGVIPVVLQPCFNITGCNQKR